MGLPAVGVCVLFHEKPDQTIECIKSFLSDQVNIYILNNNSSVGAREQLGTFCQPFPWIQIFDSPANLGVAVGRNFLLANTTEPWLWFVDNDIQMYTTDWLPVLQAHIESHPDIEVFVPLLYNVHERRYVPHLWMQVDNSSLQTHWATTPESNMFPGGAALVNRLLFHRLGLYDGAMKVGLEDWEFSLRALRAGSPIRTLSIPDILLIHEHRPVRDTAGIRAVLSRYDESTIDDSYHRVVTKYGVNWTLDYKTWLDEQKASMIEQAGEAAPEEMTADSERCLPANAWLYLTGPENGAAARNPDDMDTAVPERLLSLYPGIKVYCLTGPGEPLRCPSALAIIDLLQAAGKSVHIITDGTDAGRLMHLRRPPARITLNLTGWNTNRSSLLNYPSALEQALANFARLHSAYRNVGLACTLSRRSYPELSRVITICDRLNPAFLHLRNYSIPDLSPEQIRQIIRIGDRPIIQYLKKLIRGRPYPVHLPSYLAPVSPGVCPALTCRSYSQNITVDGAGNVGACLNQLPSASSAANLFRDQDPYSTPEMRRRRHLAGSGLYPHPECRYCWQRRQLCRESSIDRKRR